MCKSKPWTECNVVAHCIECVMHTKNGTVCITHQIECAMHTITKVCTAHHISCASLDDAGTPNLVCTAHQIF